MAVNLFDSLLQFFRAITTGLDYPLGTIGTVGGAFYNKGPQKADLKLLNNFIIYF